MVGTKDDRGSLWHRWDPHIHTPGTILNDQYSNAGGNWDSFLKRIEESNPRIRVLGITDYYSVDSYATVLGWKRENRLTEVDLLFPNIEIRFAIGTGKGSPINAHLLVSPDDPEHVDQARRFLQNFTFDAYDDSFRCEKADLTRLGRVHDRQLRDDKLALAAGTNQFKIGFEDLRREFRRSTWAQENILVAVAVGSVDGTAGLQADSSFATLRKEIERFAHIVFSSQAKQRDFWLGRGPVSVEKLQSDWGGRKPCLHGSDAHSLGAVAAPDLNRFCWIKGDVGFETLRQVCLEPEARVSVGETPPRGALPSQVITSVSVTDAPWLKTSTIPLNAGLVGIIGARGSGKTALADIIAAGGFALSSQLNERSFIRRARVHLGKSTTKLCWEDGEPTSSKLESSEFTEFFESPRVQYLSQQFVDALCSSEGIANELLNEIRRVIYQAHPPEERMGTTTFTELLELRTARGRTRRESHEEALLDAIRQLSLERGRQAGLSGLRWQREEKAASIAKDRRDRDTLVSKGSEERVAWLSAVSSAAESVRFQIEQHRRRHQVLIVLRDEVIAMRTSKAPLRLRQLRETYSEAGLTSEKWQAFLIDFTGNVDEIIERTMEMIANDIRTLSGPIANEVIVAADASPSTISLIPPDAELEKQTLSLLDKEVARLRSLIGIDTQNAKAFTRLSDKIIREEAALAKLDREIGMAEKAGEQIKDLIRIRSDSYAAVFDGIIDVEKELSALYEPLKVRLAAEEGALAKLSFSIRRSVDVGAWAQRGEELLDLRKTGPFKGHGALLGAAKAELLLAWTLGSSADVAEAMAKFRDTHEYNLAAYSPVERANNAGEYREWGAQVSAWLYSTEHIKIAYSIQYDGVDIEQLSPGTRGIVLLLLYLTIDRDDDRPLIIDQPEENLDPKSIFDELVERFRRAKMRRQIIIVTHNANLIVNTDADQVIIATCSSHRPGELPEISYQSGGLENADIRSQVCKILEGGEAAFKERARRLRIKSL